MSTVPRIAIVWQKATPADALAAAVADAWPGARVCVFGDAVAEGDAIRRFDPQLLVFGVDAASAEDAGTLRLLCRLLPAASVVVLTAPAEASGGEELARRVGARWLAWPTSVANVAEAVASARRAPSGHEPQALLDLTLGISDEVNNPLQSALGHLRLLENELAGDDAKLARVGAAIRSLRRIQATLERTRHLQRASELRAPMLPVDLAELLHELVPGPRQPATLVAGDRELLATALRDLGAVGRDLAPDDRPPEFALAQENGTAVVRLRLPASRLADWQLPRTFEPYYLSRLLRGTSHGLKLFGVHHIVAAHGGGARARRLPDGTLVFELTLPAADVQERDGGPGPATTPPP